jgi:hypothetical protein
MNTPNLAPAARLAPPTISLRIDTPTCPLSSPNCGGRERPIVAAKPNLPSKQLKPKAPVKSVLFANVPPKKEFKAIAKAGEGLRIAVVPQDNEGFHDPLPNRNGSNAGAADQARRMLDPIRPRPNGI